MTGSVAVPRTETLPFGLRFPARPGRILLWTVLFLGGIVMVSPIVFMISTSLKFSHEVYNLKLIPEEPTLENYLYLFRETNFGWWL
ncbi:MAG TPA: carbohydrate ABC transporter permease, partial [Microvirga sp.]|nr:carbohydrate ABC transporter permease [Microvirga sp.]